MSCHHIISVRQAVIAPLQTSNGTGVCYLPRFGRWARADSLNITITQCNVRSRQIVSPRQFRFTLQGQITCQTISWQYSCGSIRVWFKIEKILASYWNLNNALSAKNYWSFKVRLSIMTREIIHSQIYTKLWYIYTIKTMRQLTLSLVPFIMFWQMIKFVWNLIEPRDSALQLS